MREIHVEIEGRVESSSTSLVFSSLSLLFAPRVRRVRPYEEKIKDEREKDEVKERRTREGQKCRLSEEDGARREEGGASKTRRSATAEPLRRCASTRQAATALFSGQGDIRAGCRGWILSRRRASCRGAHDCVRAKTGAACCIPSPASIAAPSLQKSTNKSKSRKVQKQHGGSKKRGGEPEKRRDEGREQREGSGQSRCNIVSYLK